jgi:hypothetical protein
LDTPLPPHLVLQIILLGFAWTLAAMISIATYLKWREMQTMRAWPVTPGKITSSRVERREVARSSGSNQTRGSTETRNFPAVTFEYKVNGRTLSSTRYSMRINVGNYNVAETLALYPKGKTVDVAYDPANPSKAVIERTMPEGAFKAMALIAGLLVSGSLALSMLFGGAISSMATFLPNPQNAGAVILLVVMAAITARMLAMQRNMVSRASKWATVEGRVDASGLERFQVKDNSDMDGYAPWRTRFRSRVIYTYCVAGQTYASDRVAFGAITTASLRGLVSAMARRYQEGAPVTVHYDAANPTLAVLERRVGGEWLLWVLVVALVVGAAHLAGFF